MHSAQELRAGSRMLDCVAEADERTEGSGVLEKIRVWVCTVPRRSLRRPKVTKTVEFDAEEGSGERGRAARKPAGFRARLLGGLVSEALGRFDMDLRRTRVGRMNEIDLRGMITMITSYLHYLLGPRLASEELLHLFCNI